MRNYALNFPYFIGSAITGSGVGGGNLCDFSTYFNGTDEVTEQFVIKAPVNITSGFIKTILQTPYDPTQDDLFELFATIPTQPSEGDKFFALYDSGDTSKFITGEYLLSALIFSVQASNGTATVTSDFSSFAFSTTTDIGFGLEGAGNNKRIRASVDSVFTTDDEFIDMTGITFDTLVIGTDITEADTPHMHVSRLQSLLVGKTSFISNENDGNFAVSDIPDVYTITPNGGGDSFVPNYSPASNETYNMPFTDALRLNNDSITTVLSTRLTNLQNGFRFGRIFRANLNTADGQFLFEYTDSIDNSRIDGKVNAAGEIVVRVFKSTGTKVREYRSAVIVSGTINYMDVKLVGTSFTVEINGVLGTSVSTTPLVLVNIDTMVEGARGGGDNVTYDLFKIFGPTFPIVNLTTRLWTENDPAGNTFTDSDGNVWSLTDGSPADAVPPHIGGWNTSYLISDTVCAQPVGNQELVTNLGVAVTNNGEFVFNEVV